MPGQASEKTLTDIETLITTLDAVVDAIKTNTDDLKTYTDTIETKLDDIKTAIEDIGGMTALTYSAPTSGSVSTGSSTQLVGVNASRKLLILEFSLTTDHVYLGIGSAAVVSKGVELAPISGDGKQRVIFGGAPADEHAGGDVQSLVLPLTTQAINVIRSGSENFTAHIQEAT